MVAPDHPQATGEIRKHVFHSDIVNDNYDIYVRLPVGYDSASTKPYPVIFQLDVNLGILDEFNVTTGHVSSMEKNLEIPSTIVVGIGYPYNEGPGKGRLRDYTIPIENDSVTIGATGGSPAFYRFITNELIPFIQDRYPIAGPHQRALFGHSLGGLFATYAFTQRDSVSPIGGFVAASPSLWFDGGTIYKYLDSLSIRHVSDTCLLYMTMGDLEGPSMNIYFDDFCSKLKARGFSGVRFSSAKYNTDHLGTVSLSFRDGITWLFNHGMGGAQ
jgi:predicted alpha/beta superfamily hydrolase